MSEAGGESTNQSDASDPEEQSEAIPFPAFEEPLRTGEIVDNEIFGYYELTLVNFWGSWCPPCVRELPDLQRIYEEYLPKDVNVLGFAEDADRAREDVEALVEKNGLTYPILYPVGDLKENLINHLQYFPTTFLIDRNGNAVDGVNGAMDYESLKRWIEMHLDDRA